MNEKANYEKLLPYKHSISFVLEMGGFLHPSWEGTIILRHDSCSRVNKANRNKIK